MAESNSKHEDETQVISDSSRPQADTPDIDVTIAGEPPVGPAKTGDTDVFDPVEADEDPFIGQTVGGHFHVLTKLGQGGFGQVFKARDVKLDRHVAIKVLTAPMNSDYSKLFEREAKIIANLSMNANIVQIYEWGEHNGSNYMALEYIDNSVENVLSKHPDGLPLKDALEIISSCCEALEYAHDQGVLHRDIKPANILLDSKTKQTKLCDFGLARFYNKGIDSATQTIAGSPPFMPVEQIEGKTLDERSDIYSLGVTLYQILSGKLPFSGESQYEVMEKIRSSKGEQLDSHRLGLPKIVYDIVKKARARKPDDRFQSAAEFKEAIQVVLSAIEETGSADSAKLQTPKPKWVKYAVAAGIAAGISIVGLGTIFRSDPSGLTEVNAEARNLIEIGSNIQAQELLLPEHESDPSDQEITYQLAYALQRSGKIDEAKRIAALIDAPELKTEIDAVLAHASQGDSSRGQLETNVATASNGYSAVLLAMLDLSEKRHQEVITRLEGFDSTDFFYEWQKHQALQTLGQAYYAQNQFTKAGVQFDLVGNSSSNAVVADRASDFSDIIRQRMNKEDRDALVAQAKAVKASIEKDGDFDSFTSRPLRLSVKDMIVTKPMEARVAEESLTTFFGGFLNRTLSNPQGDDPKITIVNRAQLDEILEEQKLVGTLGDGNDKDMLSGIFGVRYFVTPEFDSFKGEEFVTVKIVSVSTTEEFYVDGELELPLPGSGSAEWKEWIQELGNRIRAELAKSDRLQGMLTNTANGLRMNIGKDVGVTAGMIFTLHNEPNTSKVANYTVRVTDVTDDQGCTVTPEGFSAETVPSTGWYAKQKA